MAARCSRAGAARAASVSPSDLIPGFGGVVVGAPVPEGAPAAAGGIPPLLPGRAPQVGEVAAPLLPPQRQLDAPPRHHRQPQGGAVRGEASLEAAGARDLSAGPSTRVAAGHRHGGPSAGERGEGAVRGPAVGAFEAPAASGAGVRAALTLLRGYKRFVSPVLPPVCRFEPTCSEYAGLAVAKYGVLRGGLKALGRILRCNPFFKGGLDLP